MSRKKKHPGGRPGSGAIALPPAPPGWEAREAVVRPGEALPETCPKCHIGHTHVFPLHHVLHPASLGELSPAQREAAVELLGAGIPGDASLGACCNCDWCVAVMFP